MPLRNIPCPPSANIASVDYDDDTMTLIITFNANGKGAKYQYLKVPAQVAEGFQTSGLRANAYFNSAVLNQFETQRMG